MARSSFACAESERSETSSRNSVPPSACSNLPRRPRTPVAVRSSMPKSSASSSVSTSAAQLMATKGPPRRRLRSWICRATSSLPTPLSPSIRMVKSVPATRSIVARSRSIAGRGSDERRGAVAPRPRRRAEARLRQLLTAAFDLEDERGDVRGEAEHLKIPFAERGARVEGRFEHARRRAVDTRHFEARSTRRPPTCPRRSAIVQRPRAAGSSGPESSGAASFRTRLASARRRRDDRGAASARSAARRMPAGARAAAL